MSETTPVEVGQWRHDRYGTVWAVMEPHPRRRGFWITVGSEFAYDIEVLGRRELEAMPLVDRDYFGRGNPHPGEQSYATMRAWRQIPEAGS